MMKYFMLLFVPLLVFGQTSAQKTGPFTFQKNFHVQDLVTQADNSTVSPVLYAAADSIVIDESQKSMPVFNKTNAKYLKKAGNSLEWSFYLKYGANAIGLIESLTSYEKPEKNSDRLVNLSKKKTFSNVLTFTTYALEFHALNNIGRSASHLHALSNYMSKENSLPVYEISRRLNKGKTYGLISTGLSIIGSTAMMYGLSYPLHNDEIPDNMTKGLAIGGSFGIASLVFKFISVNNIGDAGMIGNKLSANIHDNWKKEYFKGFSDGLINYKKHWKTGFSLTLSGAATMLAVAFIPTPAVQLGGFIGGGLMMLAGNIYMNWVAPYSLGDAGDNLTGLENRIANE